MSVESEVYDRLTGQLGETVAAVYDTKRLDGLELDDLPIVVLQWIDAVPLTVLDGTLVWRERRLQCSVFALDLDAARAVAEAAITALHNYRGGSIKAIRLENQFENYEPEDREYHVPVDFIITA